MLMTIHKPKAVILNDTSSRYHHGCSRVMRLLYEGLTEQGIDIIAKSPARHDWANDPVFLAALSDADVIVINGEGTLHHGKPAAEELLKIVDHPDRGATPVALINALYQDNPTSWNKWLSKCDLLAARDSESAEAMTIAGGKPARWLPDMSLTSAAAISSASRSGVIVGDSVKFSVRQILARAAAKIDNARYIPTKTLSARIWNWGPARGLLYRLYNGVLAVKIPPFSMPKDEKAYLIEISQAELHITGRFHAVCLSMLVGTPFLAIGSNASKIERLLHDAGLNTSRIVTDKDLQRPTISAPFDDDEKLAIAAFLAHAKEASGALFADIATLARTGK